MNVKAVHAVLTFKTTSGELIKHVNWSYFEAKAMLVTSTTSSEAFNRFLINYKRILNASKVELYYLNSIYFYEHVRVRSKIYKRKNITKTIQIEEDMKLKVIT